ncbi:hypothetical protein P171DRAFT_35863 [Karstenula rhodostoma CBS 690.94]|uniref:Transmembrane protein n=1 Tax=Karstenula rhodostoma CBS 690.94 TaxID=1392251 RepID=A0A9P4PHB3_9PLEO|nr:hypothetical protein P171DRAFT_35863 [Karstenula rhodostoma CBS 690.94]
MALLSTLVTSVLAPLATVAPMAASTPMAVSTPPSIPRPSNAPTLYVPDTKARNAVIFGTIASVLTIIGIFIAGATLRIAYQTRQAEHHRDSNNDDSEDPEMEMASIHGSRTLSSPTSNADGAAEQNEP